jgi:uncharacterized repeat protein (TIGR01451 family)
VRRALASRAAQRRLLAAGAALALATAGLVLATAPADAATNLVTNGGFETGDFTGWTTNGATGGQVLCNDVNYPAHSGNCAAAFGAGLGNPFTISQNLTTVAGDDYTLDFWISNDQEAGSPISFSASWNGTTVYSNANQVSTFAYTHIVISNLTATSTSTPISFSGDGNNGHRWVLDDVSVTAPAADLSLTNTPSPSTGVSGNPLTYTIAATNTGGATANAVTVTDVLPPTAVFKSASTTQGSCTRTAASKPQKNGTVTCNLGGLDGGNSATVTIVVVPTKPGSLSDTANVTSTSVSSPDSDDSAPATVTVQGT